MSALNIKQFPDELHRRMKAEAARRGMSLKAAIIAALRFWLDRTAP